jgi:predicted double-glycine peptidase
MRVSATGARSYLGTVARAAGAKPAATGRASGARAVSAIGPSAPPRISARLATLVSHTARRLHHTNNSLPQLNKMPMYSQKGNGCGTTSLAMIATYLTGKPVTQGEIDKSIRRMDIFVSPQDLIDTARARGLTAEGYNHGSLQEVRAMIDRGIPVEALINSDGRYNPGVDGLHYVVVTGYDRRADTIRFRDPNGRDMVVKSGDFEKMWKSVGFGFDRYYMAIAQPKAVLPPGRHDDVEATIHTLNGVTNITNGLHRIGAPDSFGDFASGLLQLAGGLVQTVGSGLPALALIALSAASSWIADKPLLGLSAQPWLEGMAAAVLAVSHIFNGVGEGAERIGAGLKNLVKGNFGEALRGFVDGAGKVFEGIGDAAKSIGRGIKNVGESIGRGIKNVFKRIF